MSRFLLSLVLLFTSASLWGQPINLESYLAEVLAYSFDLQVAQSQVAESEYALAAVRTTRLPSLSASGSCAYFLRHVEGQKPWSMSVEPQLVQTIYGGGVLRANQDQAELGVEVARCNVEYTCYEVIYAARYAYWNVWGLSRYAAAMREYVSIIGKEYEAIERRYAEGYTSKGDMLMISVRLSEAEFALSSAEQSLSEAQFNLNSLRGVAPNDSVDLVRATPADFELIGRVAIEQLFDQRPDYAALLLAEGVAQANLRAVRGGYNPQLVGGVVGGWQTHVPNIYGTTLLDGRVSLSLSVPIFNFSQRRKLVGEAREKELQSHLLTAALRDQIILDESSTWSAVWQGHAQMMIARESLQQASDNLEISTYSYNEGLVSIVDLLQAQISWIQLYTNAITSQYSYQLSVAEYWRVTGGGV
ncbi:MAG: TolC family protein [Rikenellaceae bacterium]